MAVAAGGLVLSGDDLSTLPPDKVAMLKKLLPATGVAAEFEDHNLSTGIVRLTDRTLLCVFNWSDQPATLPGETAGAGPCLRSVVRARLREAAGYGERRS